MSKYYCALLEGYYETEPTLASKNECSHIPDILKKEYSEVDIETLRDDFLLQDNRIIEKDDSILVYGSFPIILEEKDGKLFDVITNIPLKKYNSENPKSNSSLDTIYYRELYPAMPLAVKELLSSLDEEGIARYKSAMNWIKYTYQAKLHKLEKPRYYHLELTDTNSIERRKNPIYAEEIGGRMVEYITKMPIYCGESSAIKSNITYETATPVSKAAFLAYLNSIYMGSEKIAAGYRNFLKNQKQKAAIRYNNYTAMEIQKISGKIKNANKKTKKLVIDERLAR